jgi:major membrane immunogen (membrane-anchored lipoprotein)
MRTRTLIVGVVVALILILSACGADDAGMDNVPDGETLLQNRCDECHDLQRVTDSQKTEAEWEETVERMIQQGAELNEEEKEVLVDYLAENYGP